MAYYNQNQNASGGQGMNGQDPTEEEKNAQAQGGPVTLATGSVNNAAPVGAAPAPQNKSASSGMAPGFQNYARANQGAATNNLANAAQNNVQNLGQQANTSINQATNKFGQKVDAGTLANRYQAVQDVANTVAGARQSVAPIAPAGSPSAPVAPGSTAAPASGAATPPAAPASPLSALDQSQVNRFKDVINAQYKGPESLRQAGLYNPAQANVDTASQAIKNSATAQGRNDLLRSMYEKRGDYTNGINKLDSALLNSSQSGVSALQATAKAQGNLQNNLDQAQTSSGNLAQNRAKETQDIQNQARDVFSKGKTDEEAATDARLSGVVQNWDKLPEYFKNIIRSKQADNQKTQDQKVAEYNQANHAVDPAALAKAQADLRQAQSYAPGNLTSTYLQQQYKAPQIAKAQAALDALNSQQSTYNNGLASINNGFNKNAVNLNSDEAKMLGIQNGEGLYNLGEDAIKTGVADKNKLISKDEQFRQQALASLAGLDQSNRLDTNLKYNNADLAGTQSAMDALDTSGLRSGLNDAEKGFRTNAENTTVTGYGNKKNKSSGKRYYADTSANLKDQLSQAGYDFNSPIGNSNVNANSMVNGLNPSTSYDQDPTGTLDPYTDNSSVGNKVGQGVMDYMSAGALPLARTLGINVPTFSSLFGGSSSAASSRATAAELANDDLKSKMQGAIDSSGFNNRFGVQNNDVTNSRSAALQQLLANMDKTNSNK